MGTVLKSKISIIGTYYELVTGEVFSLNKKNVDFESLNQRFFYVFG